MRYDSHHLLWTRRTWNKGYAHGLRKLFVYQVPVPMHQKLHEVVSPIPVLSESEAKALFIEYHKLGQRLELEEALKWLVANAPNPDFAIAMMAQLGFVQNYETIYND